MNGSIPYQFKILLVKPYDGFTNSIDDLERYKALMRLQGMSNALLCLAFPITLKKAARM